MPKILINQLSLLALSFVDDFAIHDCHGDVHLQNILWIDCHEVAITYRDIRELPHLDGARRLTERNQRRLRVGGRENLRVAEDEIHILMARDRSSSADSVEKLRRGMEDEARRADISPGAFSLASRR